MGLDHTKYVMTYPHLVGPAVKRPDDRDGCGERAIRGGYPSYWITGIKCGGRALIRI